MLSYRHKAGVIAMGKRSIGDLCNELAGLAKDSDHELLSYLLRMAAAEAYERGAVAIIQGGFSFKPALGIWDWDVGNDRNYTDATCADLFGVGPKAAAKGVRNATFLKAIHPDDVAMLNNEIQKVIREGGDFTAEYRVISNGRIRWAYAKGRCTLSKSGRPERFPGAVLDITEIKARSRGLQ